MGIKRPVVMVDKVTREVILEFESVADAARYVNSNDVSIRQQCRKMQVPKTGDAYFRFKDSFDKNETFKPIAGCPIYAKHGNKVRIFSDTFKLGEALLINHVTAGTFVNEGMYEGIELGRLTNGLGALNGN